MNERKALHRMVVLGSGIVLVFGLFIKHVVWPFVRGKTKAEKRERDERYERYINSYRRTV
ncbi:MAG: hypothetical protein D8M57_13095 [Candidatus Scalindua sp. AMX11]|nr:MAG: hypothetical protein DWQ00_11995 [Candidatus Scalindua sp.]NOG83791.1 hypothetical protein [Planctomycetota bacterium]RZV82947.1 MAG: hypothetical protein EX341_09150 [Candidatus Scalindua sp. SCAELEC01]TDE64431.1 MAG: hypothetical protein D8M57_13095 [Candidatus Scalindua sp. AMX11]GJQ59758.1 MAG: hypothetical protein SCALA701_25590 [Candidatus Scalindua sp.]